jgi:hypothetical protein
MEGGDAAVVKSFGDDSPRAAAMAAFAKRGGGSSQMPRAAPKRTIAERVILFCTAAGIQMAGAMGLESATFGVTGRT